MEKNPFRCRSLRATKRLPRNRIFVPLSNKAPDDSNSIHLSASKIARSYSSPLIASSRFIGYIMRACGSSFSSGRLAFKHAILARFTLLSRFLRLFPLDHVALG